MWTRRVPRSQLVAEAKTNSAASKQVAMQVLDSNDEKRPAKPCRRVRLPSLLKDSANQCPSRHSVARDDARAGPLREQAMVIIPQLTEATAS